MTASKDESSRAIRSRRSVRFIARSLSLPPVEIESDHGGEGSISFRRLFSSDDWKGPIDFVDYTVVPSGSSIGFHGHEGNDEIYLVVSGGATIAVDGEERRVEAGDVIVTPSGSAHGLENHGEEPFVMFVVQVGHRLAMRDGKNSRPAAGRCGDADGMPWCATVPGVAWDRGGGESILRLSADRPIRYPVFQTRASCLSADSDILSGVVGERPILAVVDGNVDDLYGRAIRAHLEQRVDLAGYEALDVSETAKNLSTVEGICSRALALGFRRDGAFVGIGGGVLLDIVGFAASLFRRGVAYVRVPTTLVGQVDVGVGIKQGINFGSMKNLVGTFFPPLATINDRTFLATLDERQIRCGFAEIMKMAVVRDESLFDVLEEYAPDLVESRFAEPQHIAEEVMAVASKDMMEELQPNLFEDDFQRLVDFGHSFSPTIERVSDYSIAHGEAVAMDVFLSCLLAVDRSELARADLERITRLYEGAGLQAWSARGPTARELADGLSDVRSHRGGDLNLVVPTAIGRGTFLQDVTYDELVKAVDTAAAWTGSTRERLRSGTRW